MVQAIINLGEYEDRILMILKGKYGFKNKSEAINFVISIHDKKFLEPELKPEFIGDLTKTIAEGKYKSYHSIDELRKDIENEALQDRRKTKKNTDKNKE